MRREGGKHFFRGNHVGYFEAVVGASCFVFEKSLYKKIIRFLLCSAKLGQIVPFGSLDTPSIYSH